MSEFYNPYAFIPVTGRVNGKDTPTQSFAEIKKGENAHIRHDLWAKDAFSGRIVCAVTLKTPTIAGGLRTPGDKKNPAMLKPYRAGNRVAIPANSLRGMVATLAEALSQSALRILQDGKYRVRDGRTKRTVEGSVYSSFTSLNNTNKNNELPLPWGATLNDKPTSERPLTPAEGLFGAVSEQKQGNGLDSHNLASRLRFYDGLFLKEPEIIEEKVLKILAGPKPPSPALYFSAKNNNKAELNLNTHKPNGRKYYLHHPAALSGKVTWETKQPTENTDQKTKCELLLKRGEVFYFHIDCINLSREELGLLQFSLEPGVGFSHRLGLGKPLGLGSVKTEILGMFRLDPVRRYSTAGLDEPRYCSAYCVRLEKWQNNAGLQARYKQEAIAADNPNIHENMDISEAWVDAETLKIVNALGNQKFLKENMPVCYPFVEGAQPGEEKEGFAWFNNNDKSVAYQVLKTEIKNGALIPLHSNSSAKTGDSRHSNRRRSR